MNFPFHPLLVHFPIALLYGALFFHLLHLWKPQWVAQTTAIWVLGLAALSSLFATLSGDKEASTARHLSYPPPVYALIETHETLGNLVAWISLTFIILWIYLLLKKKSKRQIDRLALVVLILLATLVSFTGYFGGELVWNHGVGLK